VTLRQSGFPRTKVEPIPPEYSLNPPVDSTRQQGVLESLRPARHSPLLTATFLPSSLSFLPQRLSLEFNGFSLEESPDIDRSPRVPPQTLDLCESRDLPPVCFSTRSGSLLKDSLPLVPLSSVIS